MWHYIDENYLCHYGILGMKWGVRRYQNTDGSLTPAGRKRAQTRYKTGINESYERGEPYRKERTIAKGRTFYRTINGSSEDLNGSKYVTYKQSDRNLYKKIPEYMEEAALNNNGSEKFYEETFRAAEDLKIPSLDTYKSTLKDLVKTDDFMRMALKPKMQENIDSYKELLNDSNSSISDYKYWYDAYQNDKNKQKTLRKYIKEEEAKIRDYQKAIKKFESDEWFNKAAKQFRKGNVDDYYTIIASTFGYTPDLRNAVVKALSDKGYNAMVDEFGVRGKNTNMEGIDPLIIFNASKTLKLVSSKEITYKERKAAADKRSKWSEWANKEFEKDNNLQYIDWTSAESFKKAYAKR